MFMFKFHVHPLENKHDNRKKNHLKIYPLENKMMFHYHVSFQGSIQHLSQVMKISCLLLPSLGRQRRPHLSTQLAWLFSGAKDHSDLVLRCPLRHATRSSSKAALERPAKRPGARSLRLRMVISPEKWEILSYMGRVYKPRILWG